MPALLHAGRVLLATAPKCASRPHNVTEGKQNTNKTCSGPDWEHSPVHGMLSSFVMRRTLPAPRQFAYCANVVPLNRALGQCCIGQPCPGSRRRGKQTRKGVAGNAKTGRLGGRGGYAPERRWTVSAFAREAQQCPAAGVATCPRSNFFQRSPCAAKACSGYGNGAAGSFCLNLAPAAPPAAGAIFLEG